jgi:hypothetical protein
MGTVSVRSKVPVTHTPMHADAHGIGDGLLARDPHAVVLRLNFQIALADAWNLQDGNRVLALLEHVDGRKGRSARRLATQPLAIAPRSERSLQIKQRVEGVVHALLLVEAATRGEAPTAAVHLSRTRCAAAWSPNHRSIGRQRCRRNGALAESRDEAVGPLPGPRGQSGVQKSNV